MNALRPRHLLFACIPFIGWALFAALLADGAGESARSPERDSTAGPGEARRRAGALAIDIALAFSLALVLPPALAWIIGTMSWLVRDASGGRFSLGRRMAGDRSNTSSYTESYFRNVPLVLPFVGAAVELILALRGKKRLGERLAGRFA